MRNIRASKPMLVDEEDFELLNAFSWSLDNCGYARTWKSGKKIAAHRFVMDFPEGKSVDHKNHNVLDNRRGNLRICSVAENKANGLMHKDNNSGYKGVTWNKKLNKWYTQIFKGGKNYFIGTSMNPISCALAYRVAAKELNGEFANW